MTALKHEIRIDQLTMEFWAGRKLDPAKVDAKGAERSRYLKHTLDAEDAVLVAVIADFNPQDEAVRELMWRGHFLVKLGWLKERVPLLQLPERSLYRRLRWLRMMGILTAVHRTADGNKTLAYYRVSSLYWRVRQKRHEEAAAAAQRVKAVPEQAPGAEKAIAPVGHGNRKAIAPVGISHSPQGLSSLSKIGFLRDSVPSYPQLPPLGGASGAPPAAGTEPFGEIKRRFRRVDEKRLEDRRKLLAKQAEELAAREGRSG